MSWPHAADSNRGIGIQRITGSSFLRAVARGNVGGAESFGSYGERNASGAENNMAIWPNGPFAIPAASGVQMSFVSTSANDANGGTGVRSIHLHYLDSVLNPQQETIVLSGITPVLSVATDIRFIQCIHVATVGSGLVAAGVITASNSGTTYSQVATGEVRCSSAMRMVPAGKRLMICGAWCSAISGTSAARVLVRIVASEIGEHSYLDPLVLIPHASIGVQDGSQAMTFDIPFVFSAGAVVGMTETTDKAATISGGMIGWLEDEASE